MLPKTIHYCWFGNNPKPKSVLKCIDSWRRYLPDYAIEEWNEINYDLESTPLYVKQAYKAGKWAFVSDYVRLDIIYRHGGIYLDTDVEVIKSWDSLLHHDFFIGRQPGFQVNTGAGFGAVKGHPVLKIMLDDYKDVPFIKPDGSLDLWTCPHRNSQWLFKHGMKSDNSYQEIENVAIYPIEYFSPLEAYSRQLSKTSNTYSIHHCDGSWSPAETSINHCLRYIRFRVCNAYDTLVHFPNRILKSILGTERYEAFKQKIKGKS